MQTSKCRQAGCSVHSVEYEVPVSQIEALILMSGECEQYVRYYDHWIIVETRGKTSLNIKLRKIKHHHMEKMQYNISPILKRGNHDLIHDHCFGTINTSCELGQ